MTVQISKNIKWCGDRYSHWVLRLATLQRSSWCSIHSTVNLFGFGSSVQQATTTFTSDQRPITIQSFVPEQNGAGRVHPAVIALHGSGGIQNGWAESPATMLASRGFAVFVLHYFERTGTQWADEKTIRQSFEVWMKTISDAISYAGKQPGVDGKRVGLLGFSLGAYLALSVAAVDPRVKAVVDYFGGLPEEVKAYLGANYPPVLILHGGEDPVVPVSEAHSLQKVFQQNGIEYEAKIYPYAGHGFSGLDLLDAGQRTLRFLESKLR